MRSNQITNNIFVHVIITRIGHLNFTRNTGLLNDSGINPGLSINPDYIRNKAVYSRLLEGILV